MWSTWWKELMGIGRGVGLGSWFDDNMVQMVGQTPLFFCVWKDRWLSSLLFVRYRRLFYLTKNRLRQWLRCRVRC